MTHYSYHKNRITTNEILHPTKRFISNWNREFMTSDGPNTTARIKLDDIGIPCDEHYHSRLVLPANAQNFFLNFRYLTDVTFLLIKVTYNGNYEYDDFSQSDNFDPFYNQNYQQLRKEENSYNIFYYFEDNSGVTYPINRLLLLNGSYINNLPRIFLNNPLDYDVELDILHGNINPPKYIPPVTGVTIITNLYYNDIITNTTACGPSGEYIGSSSFIVNGYLSNGTLGSFSIPYNSFNQNDDPIILERDLDNLSIYVYTYWDIISQSVTSSLNKVILKFLTDFNCNQAYSRMMFALYSYINYDEEICRYLTEDNVYENDQSIICSNSGLTGTDMMSPVIYYNSSDYWDGSGTTIPYNVILPLRHGFDDDPCTGDIIGWTIEELKELFINVAIDCWDGDITDKVKLILCKAGSTVALDSINEDGVYNITIKVTDNANNTTIHNFIKK